METGGGDDSEMESVMEEGKINLGPVSMPASPHTPGTNETATLLLNQH